MAPRKAAQDGTSFSADEREAMKNKIAEEKAEKAARKGGKKLDGEADLLAKIAEMTGLDRQIAERLHAIVRANAPGLLPKTWYGMPAYAGPNGKVLCFFTPAGKFKDRYATLGFNADAALDEGHMWPTAFALTRLDGSEEQAIVALLKRAVGQT